MATAAIPTKIARFTSALLFVVAFNAGGSFIAAIEEKPATPLSWMHFHDVPFRADTQITVRVFVFPILFGWPVGSVCSAGGST
jgi:hypothetical protein